MNSPGRWAQTHQQTYNRTAEKAKKDVTTAMPNLATSAWLKCSGRTLRELCINRCPQTSINWSSAWKSLRSFLHKWGTDFVTQKLLIPSYCCQRSFTSHTVMGFFFQHLVLMKKHHCIVVLSFFLYLILTSGNDWIIYFFNHVLMYKPQNWKRLYFLFHMASVVTPSSNDIQTFSSCFWLFMQRALRTQINELTQRHPGEKISGPLTKDFKRYTDSVGAVAFNKIVIKIIFFSGKAVQHSEDVNNVYVSNYM